jgi:hypothetical protein
MAQKYIYSHEYNLNDTSRNKKEKDKSVVLTRKRTIPTERLPLVGEVSANFCG